MLAGLLAPTLLLLARAMQSLAQSTATEQILTIQTSVPSIDSLTQDVPTVLLPSSEEGIMSILPIFTTSSSVDIPGFPSSAASTDTGMMSIPAGETPLFTNSSGIASSTTPPGSSGIPSSSGNPSASPTSAASSILTTGSGVPLLAMACSGLSVAFGFAWLLL